MSVLITVRVYMLEGCVKVYYHARNGTLEMGGGYIGCKSKAR